MIRAGDGTSQFLYIKEGVTQGDPLNMVAYELGILPLIRELQKAHPGVTQTWYADGAWAGITSEGFFCNIDDFIVRRPPRG